MVHYVLHSQPDVQDAPHRVQTVKRLKHEHTTHASVPYSDENRKTSLTQYVVSFTSAVLTPAMSSDVQT